MRKLMLAGALALSLSACGTMSAADRRLAMEKIDTDIALANVGIQSTMQTFEAAHPEKREQAEAIRRGAWKAAQTAHQAYLAGEVVNASVLANFAQQASALSAGE